MRKSELVIPIFLSQSTLLTLTSFARLNASEQQELQKRMETKQMQEFMKVCQQLFNF